MPVSPDPRPGGRPQGGPADRLRQHYARVRSRLDDPATRPGTLAVLAALALVLGAWVYWQVLVFQLPSVDDLRRARFAQASVAYTADGEVLTRYQTENRMWVALDSIAKPVVEALVATEDHRFYSHRGIDVRRFFGSAARTLGGDAQGGSTITMQLARNIFPTIADDWVGTRKVKEWITALRVEAMYSKEDILEMYLNMVPFMYNAFGIEAAAQTYFQKHAYELDLGESATLVGMLKGTVYYNPVRNPERSHERRNVVLQQMVKHGLLAEADYEALEDEETELDFRRLSRTDNLAPYFAEHVRRWLDEWAEEHGYNLYTDGLRVYTTIDSRLQKAADEAVSRVGDDLQAVAEVEWSAARPPLFSASAAAYRNASARSRAFAYLWESRPELLDTFLKQTSRYRTLTRSGLGDDDALDSLRADAAFVDSVKALYGRVDVGFVAVEPANGFVRAWVGGRDLDKDQYDHVAQAKRQPGSTFKPFVYAAALDNGYSPDTRLPDRVVEYVDPDTRRRWRPTNVSGASGRMMTLRDALAYSKNTITAQVVMDLGPQRVADYARRMGIESELKAVPSLGLGTSEVTLLEMTAAYATLAAGGVHHKPVFVTRIEDAQGNVVGQWGPEGEDVLSPTTAYAVLDMMRGVVEYGTGRRISGQFGASGDLAGKTGTTQGGADGWFFLVHPNLVMGSWVGFPSPSITFRSDFWGQGAHTALYTVGEFYRRARRTARDVLDPNAVFPAPAGYRAPVPADTVLFAADTLGYDPDYVGGVSDVPDSLGFDVEIEDPGVFELETLDSTAVAPPEPTAPRSASDSLNQRERRGPPGQRTERGGQGQERGGQGQERGGQGQERGGQSARQAGNSARQPAQVRPNSREQSPRERRGNNGNRRGGPPVPPDTTGGKR